MPSLKETQETLNYAICVCTSVYFNAKGFSHPSMTQCPDGKNNSGTIQKTPLQKSTLPEKANSKLNNHFIFE